MGYTDSPPTHKADLYFVALMKDGRLVYIKSGPFGLCDEAETAMLNIEDPGGSCYLEVVKTETTFEEI